jgi:hypothetical protein
VGNGVADDRPAFVAADGAGGTLYVPRGTYRIGSNLALASDIRFEQGAKLKPDSGVTVTLNGGLDAGVFQVFDVSAGGKVKPNRVEEMIPQWWGAVANGSADDYPAIAAALLAARKSGEYGAGGEGAVIFFPPGVYRVTQPLDGGTAGQVTLRGSGRFETVIRGDTGAGRSIIEMVGTRYAAVRDLQLDVRGMENPSTVGILLARVSINGFAAQAGNVDISNVVIQLRSQSTANGGRGTVGIYNYCSELCDYHDVYVSADTGAVYSSANVFNLTSAHRPAGSQYPMFTGESSMTACTMSGANVLAGLAGPALLLAGCANIKIDSHLTTPWTEHAGLTGPYRYAINVISQLTDFEFHGGMEGYPVLLRNQSSISGMRLHAYSGWSLTDPRIYLDEIPGAPSHATLLGCVIDVVPTPDAYVDPDGAGPVQPTATGYLIDTTASAASQVVGCVLHLRSGKVRIQNPWGNSNLTGNTVFFEGSLANVVFQAPVVQGNVIHATDRTDVAGVTVGDKLVNGVRLDAGKLGVGNAAAATTIAAPGTVVKKIEVFDAAGASLGFVPVYASIT